VLPVTVVIPTRDRPAQLHDAIVSMLAGSCLPAEIVVADQSTGPMRPLPGDDSPVDVRRLHLATPGLSRGRNAGLAAARHDLLVFADDDVVADPDWLCRMVGALDAAPPRTAISGAVLDDGGGAGFVPSTTTRTEPHTFTGRQFGDPLFAGNMAIRRAAFAALGTFDERLGAGAEFPGSEDNDFGFRLLEAGWAIRFVPDAVVRHRGARHGRELLRLDWAYARGQGAFYAKHRHASDRFMWRRFGRNARFRLARLRTAPRMLRGDYTAVRELVYLAGLVTGALAWLRRHGRGG
jgi:GT2 family glycosyltransferase